jgi:hypothetical protein
MKKYTLELGETPLIKIDSIVGDLRLSGHDETYLEIQSPQSGQLKVTEEEGGAEISCLSGCLVFVPRAARIEGEAVSGRCRISDVEGEILLRTVGGDLSLRRLSKVSLELVGGDMQARRLSSDLSVDRIGGDVVVQDIKGTIRLRMVGGDLILRDVEGAVDANCGGDALLTFQPATGTQSKVRTGGDLDCRLTPDASVTLTVQAGGDTDISPAVQQGESQDSFKVGGGDADLELSCGGDACLRVGDETSVSGGLNFADVLTEVDADLAEMEAKFDALGAGLIGFDADRVGERVKRAVRRARRSAHKAKRKHLEFKADFKLPGDLADLADLASPLAGFSSSADQVGDEERLSILRMVEQGKISVDEAESLLKALEGES